MEAEKKKIRLLVDEERASDGIWSEHRLGGWSYHGVRGLNLPQWLIDRIVFWCSWYEGFYPHHDFPEERTIPGDMSNEKQFYAYKISIAYDLQITLGDGYEILYHDENEATVKVALPYDPKWGQRRKRDKVRMKTLR